MDLAQIPLNALRAFEAAARHESFTRAGLELRVTQALPADTEALRARWPEVLEAVQGKRRVAWMQLSDASVESFADNVLVLAFARAGVAKGFLTGGYDKDLGQVLETLLGVTPVIRTEVLGVAGSVITFSHALAGPRQEFVCAA